MSASKDYKVADISLAEKNLGYKTLVKFEDGLARTVEWYKESMPSLTARAK